MEKACSRCGLVKSVEHFYKYVRKTPKVRNFPHDGYRAQCKACYLERANAWKAANPEKRREIVKRWAENNPCKVKQASKNHRQKDSAKKKAAVWRKQNAITYLRGRRRSDPMYAFKIKMRSILLKAFYRNGYTKRSKSQQILGCTWPELVAHIESKFQPGMTWENRGEWHIDHIIPLATAETEADIVRLNHYTNLQPLWAEDNLRKSDKVITTQKEENGICESR